MDNTLCTEVERLQAAVEAQRCRMDELEHRIVQLCEVVGNFQPSPAVAYQPNAVSSTR